MLAGAAQAKALVMRMLPRRATFCGWGFIQLVIPDCFELTFVSHELYLLSAILCYWLTGSIKLSAVPMLILRF